MPQRRFRETRGTNKYAYDPRNDFLNWSVLHIGPFDDAADVWGVTYAAAWVELFDMSYDVLGLTNPRESQEEQSQQATENA